MLLVTLRCVHSERGGVVINLYRVWQDDDPNKVNTTKKMGMSKLFFG